MTIGSTHACMLHSWVQTHVPVIPPLIFHFVFTFMMLPVYGYGDVDAAELCSWPDNEEAQTTRLLSISPRAWSLHPDLDNHLNECSFRMLAAKTLNTKWGKRLFHVGEAASTLTDARCPLLTQRQGERAGNPGFHEIFPRQSAAAGGS